MTSSRNPINLNIGTASSSWSLKVRPCGHAKKWTVGYYTNTILVVVCIHLFFRIFPAFPWFCPTMSLFKSTLRLSCYLRDDYMHACWNRQGKICLRTQGCYKGRNGTQSWWYSCQLAFPYGWFFCPLQSKTSEKRKSRHSISSIAIHLVWRGGKKCVHIIIFDRLAFWWVCRSWT